MLTAEFADRKACPVCHKPARRLGRWYIAQGEWRFQAEPLFVRGPRAERPDKDAHLWENYPRTVEFMDKSTGLMRSKQAEEWYRVAHYECIGGRHDSDECCGLFARIECDTYEGEHFWWMDAPGEPTQRTVPTDIFDRKKASAGDRG